MDSLLQLAERCEALEVVDRHTMEYLFREVAMELWGGPRLKDWDAEQIRHAAWHRFFTLVQAEAWLDAAMMLKPERCWGDVGPRADGKGYAELCGPVNASATAATPALALLAAALRARHSQGVSDNG